MKKQFKNILIIVFIIIGIITVWFIKNKDNIVEIENDNNVEFIEENDINKDKIETEENDVGDVALDIPLEEDIPTEGNSVGNDVLDIPLQDKIETEENNVGDGILDVPVSEIDNNDPNFDLSTPSFDIETLTSYGLPILLDFGAEWCGPCKRMHPILEELNSELRGKAIIKYADVDEYPEATQGFRFTLIPTQYFITKDGEIYKSHTGIISKEDAIVILKEMGMEE